MKASSKFDFIIVGGGLSGLHLSYCFLNDKYFKDYSILIIALFFKIYICFKKAPWSERTPIFNYQPLF